MRRCAFLRCRTGVLLIVSSCILALTIVSTIVYAVLRVNAWLQQGRQAHVPPHPCVVTSSLQFFEDGPWRILYARCSLYRRTYVSMQERSFCWKNCLHVKLSTPAAYTGAISGQDCPHVSRPTRVGLFTPVLTTSAAETCRNPAGNLQRTQRITFPTRSRLRSGAATSNRGVCRITYRRIAHRRIAHRRLGAHTPRRDASGARRSR